jgi:SAM-dependent methyltransferase
MAQNIYDNPEFLARYSQLPRQVHGLEGAPEWPVMRAMLPELGGKRVVDLACGMGAASRFLSKEGAALLLGLDLSRAMLARARAATSDPAITYAIADLEELELSAHSFDLVFCMLAFHYVADFTRLVTVIHQALAPGSQLIFSIEHPIFMAAAQPHWIQDADGHKTWPVNGYAREGIRRTDWFVRDVVKFHRTLAATLNTLIAAGFVIDRLAEFAPTEAQIEGRPSLAEELERPMILLVSASA